MVISFCSVGLLGPIQDELKWKETPFQTIKFAQHVEYGPEHAIIWQFMVVVQFEVINQEKHVLILFDSERFDHIDSNNQQFS
jgi:hypothetical protein